MNTYYVSLTGDLLGAYLVYRAPDEAAVRRHLAAVYWYGKLPWCAIYDETRSARILAERAILIPAACGDLS